MPWIIYVCVGLGLMSCTFEVFERYFHDTYGSRYVGRWHNCSYIVIHTIMKNVFCNFSLECTNNCQKIWSVFLFLIHHHYDHYFDILTTVWWCLSHHIDNRNTVKFVLYCVKSIQYFFIENGESRIFRQWSLGTSFLSNIIILVLYFKAFSSGLFRLESAWMLEVFHPCHTTVLTLCGGKEGGEGERKEGEGVYPCPGQGKGRGGEEGYLILV